MKTKIKKKKKKIIGELKLNFRTWRCGDDPDYLDEDDSTITKKRLGRKQTYLYNPEESHGMCCLGQFALQLDKKLTKEDIQYCGTPSKIGNFAGPLLLSENGEESSDFSNKAVLINDNTNSSIAQKIKKLTILCREYGYKLKVTNKPKSYDKEN